MSLLVLLPSPLLGARTWDPVADALRRMGRQVVVVELSGPAPGSAQEALSQYLDALADVRHDQDLVLVPHSNAGLYVPAIAAERTVRAAVFVDASLPPAAGSRVPVAPPRFLTVLAQQADAGGRVLPWTRWWGEEERARLVPDLGTRRAVEAEQRRLPLSYFRDAVPVPEGWSRLPAAYLAFGGPYLATAREAGGRGWPVRVLRGHHLEMLRRPQAVAEGVSGLLDELA